ncbi:hypothetical protein ASU31_00630 [Pedobacter ginsenosidimutans]|uniref:Uncharacterized protein n=1 Tax=Pedobacter ginsenosidimutans TaxID=687842 RepID=A0A0T5VVE1_9SPHI|nr:hypothetical protein ASU31_00630 [Pedobacter ginsenosidimutans]
MILNHPNGLTIKKDFLSLLFLTKSNNLYPQKKRFLADEFKGYRKIRSARKRIKIHFDRDI